MSYRIYPPEVDPTVLETSKLSDKAAEIIRVAEANDLPPRIAASPDFHVCRFCPFHTTCWEATP